MDKKKIKSQATKLNNSKDKIDTNLNDIDYNKRKGRIAFSSVCHNKCSISKWQGKELTSLIDTFKKIEESKWEDILIDAGLQWKRDKHIAFKLPDNLPEDVKLHSMRVDGKMRIFGYRAQEYFYIVWFDKNHEVCPEGKNKIHTA